MAKAKTETRAEKAARLKKEADALRIVETKKELIKEFGETKHKGFVSRVCKVVGIRTQTYYNYVADDKEFAEKVQEVIRDSREEMLDEVEECLIDVVRQRGKGTVAAAKLLLDNYGKSRGYGQDKTSGDGSQEPGAEGVQINVNFHSSPTNFNENEEWQRPEFDTRFIKPTKEEDDD